MNDMNLRQHELIYSLSELLSMAQACGVTPPLWPYISHNYGSALFIDYHKMKLLGKERMIVLALYY